MSEHEVKHKQELHAHPSSRPRERAPLLRSVSLKHTHLKEGVLATPKGPVVGPSLAVVTHVPLRWGGGVVTGTCNEIVPVSVVRGRCLSPCSHHAWAASLP